jgi:D-3-phosphoglycerate dehydrogenase
MNELSDKTTLEYEQMLNEYTSLDLKQYALKIALNSLFGAVANIHCVFYDIRMAESITKGGRFSAIGVGRHIKTIDNINEVLEEITLKYSPSDQVEGMILDTRRINLNDYPKLRVISRIGVGIDNIDQSECNRRGIKFYTTPCEELTPSVAEFTVMQILTFLRKNREILNRKWIGIIGYGRIGKKVCRILEEGFDCFICYCDIFQNEQSDVEYYYSLEAVLKCDIICVHVSGSKEVIGIKEIQAMNSNVILVNMAREGCVNINAIINALKQEKLGGYITDVDDLEGLDNLSMLPKNILVTPHIASDTFQARRAMENMALENLIYGLNK